MADNDITLDSLREQIDALDKKIHALLNERARCAQKVADVKLAEVAPEERDQVKFYRPEREAQVLRHVQQRNVGPLPDESIAHIFREIMSACLALEKPLTVAYLGPEGTFTHAAAIKHFGHGLQARSVDAIAQIFSDVESEEVIYGVVPVENSTEGMVNHTLDNFMQSTVKICGEVELPIKLLMLASKSATPTSIKRICAHQQALAQCRNWLDNHWPDIPREAVSSNAKAVEMAAADPSIAAVAGEMAVDVYDVSVLAENIQDLSQNTTRFLVIGKEDVGVSGKDKTSVIVSTRNIPGALFKLLGAFNQEQVMLTRIDTRPSRTENWAYVFFIEFEGHLQDAKIQRIMAEIEEHSVVLKPLGSYPKAVI